MDIKISKHAAEQAAVRGISEEGIRAVVSGAVGLNVTVESKHDPTAKVIVGMYANKLWGIIVNMNIMNVITVRRARKDEEKLYEKEEVDRSRTRRIL